MKQYHDLLQLILDKGTWKEPARENMPRTKAIFGHQMRFDLSEGFPILTTKKVSFKNIVVELLWFLKGDTNIKYLVDNGCNIWNEDAYNFYQKLCKKQNLSRTISFELFCSYIKNAKSLEELKDDSFLNSKNELLSLIPQNYVLGDCGKQYGALWRKWGFKDFFGGKCITYETYPIDQIAEVIKSLQTNPEGRRHIITAWNPNTLDQMALNACHVLVQFNCRKLTFWQRVNLMYQPNAISTSGDLRLVEESLNDANIPKYYLDCQLYQRSGDVFLGVPYNIASYALLTMMFSQILNMVPGDFIHTFGDVHIYENHISQVEEQLSRDVNKYPLPKLDLSLIENALKNWELIGLDNIFQSLSEHISDFKLDNYQSYPTIKAELSTGLKK